MSREAGSVIAVRDGAERGNSVPGGAVLEREEPARKAGVERVISGQPHVRVIHPVHPSASPRPSIPGAVGDAGGVVDDVDPDDAAAAVGINVAAGAGAGAGARVGAGAGAAADSTTGTGVAAGAGVDVAVGLGADVGVGVGAEASGGPAGGAGEVTRPQVLGPSAQGALWAALQEERFVLGHCQRCGAWLEPVAAAVRDCEQCGGPAVLESADGTGVVQGVLVMRHPDTPAFAGRAPYALVLVTLAEGVRLSGRLDGVPADEVPLGLPVRAALAVRPGSTEPHVVFRPRVPAAAGVH
ncbi:Zn-ribbon domain-containing OB-fold protein [Candidatus Frankia nodulisporulans]|uniref:Zn-ribbon domain-containing OB-fold protein n=1 Tax=Candidatus Frankia nodulisporulans TaxID=2060052 RepID=UPI00177FA14A|nr:OB-fold domain-containing protein [Candidatus Frankia nodulisporulans]